MTGYDYISNLLCNNIIVQESTTLDNVLIGKLDSPLEISETNNTLQTKLELTNAGGNGCSTAIEMSPWKSRPAGCPASVVCVDRDYSADLKYKFSQHGNGGNNASQIRATMNYNGLRIGDDQLPTEKLDVVGTVQCDSIMFRNEGIKMIPMLFQIPVISNEENVVNIKPYMVSYGITGTEKFLGLDYWLLNTLSKNINVEEYDGGVEIKYKIVNESGDVNLHIKKKGSSVTCDLVVQIWWAV